MRVPILTERRFKVVVLQYRLLHYRVGLFERLREKCKTKKIDLYLVHGQPTKSELKKRDVGVLSWADVVVNKYLTVGGRDILWQPFPNKHLDADLIVVMQENRLLSNYPLLISRLWSKRKVAYWGHGVNFQSIAPTGFRERWKRLMLKRVDWWFAYTEITRNVLREAGYPESRISVLNNSIDSEGFKGDLVSVADTELLSLRQRLGFSESDPVALFCGSLYPDKRLDFMVEVAVRIRESLPTFQYIVIGDGPSMPQLRELARGKPWIHIVGTQRGLEKAKYFRVAQCILNPGAVGLHVLDSFCSGLPMFTLAGARHGPEVAYLKHGYNGFLLDEDSLSYADAVVRFLRDDVQFNTVRRNAFESGMHYSLDNMVGNFCSGIEGCLSLTN